MRNFHHVSELRFSIKFWRTLKLNHNEGKIEWGFVIDIELEKYNYKGFFKFLKVFYNYNAYTQVLQSTVFFLKPLN